MIAEGKNTQERFSDAFYGHLQAFFLSAKRSDAVFSIARLTVEISVGHGDMENVCYHLKKICFCAEWRGVSCQGSPDDETGFHAPHRCPEFDRLPFLSIRARGGASMNSWLLMFP